MSCDNCHVNDAEIIRDFNVFEPTDWWKEKHQKICKDCYIKEELLHCSCCGLYFHCDIGELFYNCEICEKDICSNKCVAITGCQTRICVCKKCFEYKCRKCGSPIPILPEGELYFWDADPVAKCEKC